MTEIAAPTPLSADAAHALLRGRRSIRHYRPEMPARAVLERIFVSAAHAPSAHNRQPWRFLVVADAALKARLAAAMGARLAADRHGDGDLPAAIRSDVDRSYRRITGAPVVVAVALTLAEMDRYPDAARARAEYLMAVQSTAMATQSLLLAAHAEGLGACWMCAPLFCQATVREVLAMPDDWEPQGLLTLGHPARPGSLKSRKPLTEFVIFVRPSLNPVDADLERLGPPLASPAGARSAKSRGLPRCGWVKTPDRRGPTWASDRLSGDASCARRCRSRLCQRLWDLDPVAEP